EKYKNLDEAIYAEAMRLINNQIEKYKKKIEDELEDLKKQAEERIQKIKDDALKKLDIEKKKEK
ncbi:MAG TPA: hypothetical protein DCM40_45535, partial [Maribacter sp.]|nr:hypothetical protein [Maribacter sp.]